MKNAVLLHGKPTKERYMDPTVPKPHEANWFPWIKAGLLKRGIPTTIPPLLRPYFPEYGAWERIVEAENVGATTGLVGHSAGAEFAMRWLSSNKHITVERVILVAPYCDYAGKYGDFSKYPLDTTLSERIGKLTIINSIDDDKLIQRRTQDLVDAFPTAKLVELDGYGHFLIGNRMSGPEFPVLLDELTAP